MTVNPNEGVYGECVIETWRDYRGGPWARERFVVVRADPIVLCAASLLEEIAATTGQPEARASLVDDVLTFRADNRTVVYVVDQDSYDPLAETYVARWPD